MRSKNIEYKNLCRLKGKRYAERTETGSNIEHQCIKSKAELELNIDGSKSIKKLILE